MNPSTIEEMPFGHPGMLVAYEHVDLKTGEISKSAVLVDPDEMIGPDVLAAHPLLVVRNKQGLFQIWGDTPDVMPDRFEGESVQAEFHNLDSEHDLEVA